MFNNYENGMEELNGEIEVYEALVESAKLRTQAYVSKLAFGEKALGRQFDVYLEEMNKASQDYLKYQEMLVELYHVKAMFKKD